MAGTKARSARGVVVDFDLLAIKEKLAATPKPVEVKERENFIAQKSRRRRTRKVEEVEKTTEEVAEETAAALTTVDSEFGRITDPVRMYMREMGSVNLLNRHSEISIAKRIEQGIQHMLAAMTQYPKIIELVLADHDKTERGEKRLSSLILGFFDVNICG